jgi:hypothetical protein
LDPEAEKPKGKKAPVERTTNRPFIGLTQVNRQIRSEFFPIYSQKQEIGLDLVDVAKYLATMYNDATLTDEQKLENLKPFKGDLTIAVSGTVSPAEQNGIEMVGLLVLWATAPGMNIGFGE